MSRQDYINNMNVYKNTDISKKTLYKTIQEWARNDSEREKRWKNMGGDTAAAKQLWDMHTIDEQNIFTKEGYSYNTSLTDINYTVYGEIDPDKEFYIVYSTSAHNYQNWQTELLEFTIKSSKDRDRCQIIKLLAYDNAAKDDNFELGSDVTFVFPSGFEDPSIGEHFALLNKPNSFIALTEYWLFIKKYNPNANFVLLDPDMIWNNIIDKIHFPKRGEVSGHWFNYTEHDKTDNIMFPKIIRVVDLNLIVYKYLKYSKALYHEHKYHSEMYGFIKSIKEHNIKQTIIKHFGPSFEVDNNIEYATFLHYCQSFLEDGTKVWFKQDYTPETNTRPWKRPYNWKLCKNKLNKSVLYQIHKLIDYQGSKEYISPRIIKREELI